MKKLWSLSAILTFALLIGAACQSASTANTTANNAGKAANNSAAPKTDDHAHEQDDAPRIALADAKKDFDAGKAVFVDTRSADAFKLEHIKGAINIPAGEFETRYAAIPKDKKIIAYCS